LSSSPAAQPDLPPAPQLRFQGRAIGFSKLMDTTLAELRPSHQLRDTGPPPRYVLPFRPPAQDPICPP
jgi:hypothetical protein